MSTHAVIGFEGINDGWGRYCHYDGYPTGVGAKLCEIVRRDGVEESARVLVEKNFAWSDIDPDVWEGRSQLSEGYQVIQGYGTAETTASADDWEAVEGDPWGYLVHEDGMVDVFHDGMLLASVDAFADDYDDHMYDAEHDFCD